VEEIRKHKRTIEAAGFRWSVVESIPVHEAIKQGRPEASRYIHAYLQSMIHLASEGIKTVTYNFMPVLDWTRTNLAYALPDGSLALRFDQVDLVYFDVYLLQRKGAENDYPMELLEQAKRRVKSISQQEKDALTANILAGLPGAEEGYTLSKFKSMLQAYQSVGEEGLREHLCSFVKTIAAVASEHGMKLAIHPDDPPFPIFGLPRVVSTEKDVLRLYEASPEPANGLCFCTGSFGVRPDNDLPAMVKNLGNRIHFVHLRNTTRETDGSFYEADHLGGDTDMYEVLRELLSVCAERKVVLPFRPDHGHQMLDDLNKKTNPGYSAIGRLRGLAELRGLALGINRAMQLEENE
jgi:mannonate dehydratase